MAIIKFCNRCSDMELRKAVFTVFSLLNVLSFPATVNSTGERGNVLTLLSFFGSFRQDWIGLVVFPSFTTLTKTSNSAENAA